MAFDAEDFLAVARELAAGSTKGHHRSAVSRAYYAAFWRARARLAADNGSSPDETGENSHNRLWDYFVGDRDANGDSLGEQGRRLKNARNKADYRSRPTTRVEAERAVELAARLIAAIDALV
jgi:uncharacterized protein (UPF0332 family)